MGEDPKLDLEAKAFSIENALCFTQLSEIAYESEADAKAILQGDGGTKHGMSVDLFHWFEVCT